MTSIAATSTPTLSILLLCWNHARFLEQCIRSIASQGPQDFEIIFLDNVSTDGSFELAGQLFEHFELQATMIRNTAPQSISANCNRLLRESSSELVALLSTDDWYDSNYVARIRETAMRFPESVMYAANGWSYYEITDTKVPSNIMILENERVGSRFLFEAGCFFWVGLCYRRTALQNADGWDEDQIVEDIDLLYRLTRYSRITQIPDYLIYYRRSASSVSLDPVFMAQGRLLFYRKHRRSFGRTWRRIVSSMLRSSAAVAIDKKQFRGALKLLIHSIYLRPLEITTWRTVLYLFRSIAHRSQ